MARWLILAAVAAFAWIVHAADVGIPVDHEYRALAEFDTRIAIALQANSVSPNISSLVDLVVLYHLRDERWKQGGSWESLGYTDLLLDHVMTLYSPLRQRYKTLIYAVYLHRARTLHTLGEFRAAIATMDVFLQQLDRDPSDARRPPPAGQISQLRKLKAAAHFTIGRALISAGQAAQASAAFKEAFALNPCVHQAYYQLALTLSATKNTTFAQTYIPFMRYVRSRVVLNTSSEVVHLASEEGDAECAFDRDEDFFFELYRQGARAQEEAAVLTASAESQYRIIDAALHWTLFVLYDLVGDAEQAFSHLMRARDLEAFRLYASPFVEPPERTAEATRHIVSFFQPGFWPLRTEDLVGSTSLTPVFVVGYFRSGSTLLEQLLCVDKGIQGVGELSSFTHAMHPLQSDLVRVVEVDVQGDGHATLTRLAEPLRHHAELILEAMRRRLRGDEAYTNLTARALPLRAPRPAGRADHIVDKMLLNFRNIALLHLVFPRALILHTVRDPMDTLWSCLRNRFGDFSACSLPPAQVVRDYALYLEVMHHFHQVLPRLRPAGGGAPRSAILDVRYEELVASPAKVLRRVFALLDRPMPPVQDLQRFHQSERAVHTASFLQVKEPIYSKSVGGWRKYQEQLQREVAPLLHIELERLRAKGALPYAHGRGAMNWDLRADFDYVQHLRDLR